MDPADGISLISQPKGGAAAKRQRIEAPHGKYTLVRRSMRENTKLPAETPQPETGEQGISGKMLNTIVELHNTRIHQIYHNQCTILYWYTRTLGAYCNNTNSTLERSTHTVLDCEYNTVDQPTRTAECDAPLKLNILAPHKSECYKCHSVFRYKGRLHCSISSTRSLYCGTERYRICAADVARNSIAKQSIDL